MTQPTNELRLALAEAAIGVAFCSSLLALGFHLLWVPRTFGLTYGLLLGGLPLLLVLVEYQRPRRPWLAAALVVPTSSVLAAIAFMQATWLRVTGEFGFGLALEALRIGSGGPTAWECFYFGAVGLVCGSTLLWRLCQIDLWLQVVLNLVVFGLIVLLDWAIQGFLSDVLVPPCALALCLPLGLGLGAAVVAHGRRREP